MELKNPRTGISVNYNIEGSTNPTIIFIHGWTANYMRWALVKNIVKEKYRCVDFDLRGHGHSQKTNDLEYSFAAHVEDLAGLMDGLKIDSAVLVGHSMGGMIAQHFALKYPERVEKIVLVATASRVAATDADKRKLRLFAWLFRHCFKLMISIKDAKKKKMPDKFPDLLDASLRAVAKSAADSIIALTTYDLTARLSEIKVPALILAAEDDETVPIKFTREMAAGISGARLVVYDSPCGHHVNIERYREVAEEIFAFVG